jgi:hypothetical protein
VHGEPWFYSGFFVETGDVVGEAPVFSLVGNSIRRYLYKIDSNWIMSQEIGSVIAEAYVEDLIAMSPAAISSRDWHFGEGIKWSTHKVEVISGNRDNTVVRNLHLHRRISSLPPQQKFFELANGIVMPAVGIFYYQLQVLLKCCMLLLSVHEMMINACVSLWPYRLL